MLIDKLAAIGAAIRAKTGSQDKLSLDGMVSEINKMYGEANLETKSVTAGTATTAVTPSAGKALSAVTVNPTPSETRTVTPNWQTRTYSPSAGKLFSKVTVLGDSNLKEENIRSGAIIFDVEGTHMPTIEYIGGDYMLAVSGYVYTSEQIRSVEVEYTMKADGKIYYSGGSWSNASYSSTVIRCVIMKKLANPVGNDPTDFTPMDARSMSYASDYASDGTPSDRHWGFRGSMIGKSFDAKKGDIIKVILQANRDGDGAFLDAWAVYP